MSESLKLDDVWSLMALQSGALRCDLVPDVIFAPVSQPFFRQVHSRLAQRRQHVGPIVSLCPGSRPSDWACQFGYGIQGIVAVVQRLH